MRSVNFGEFERIAEDSIEGPADRPDLLELTERLIDLGTAGAKQQCKLALRHSEVQRQPLSWRWLAFTDGDQEKTRQSNMHRVKCDRLELPTGLPQSTAEKRYQSLRQHRPSDPDPAKILFVEPVCRD